MAGDRTEQEPVAAAIFEMTQGGSAHGAAPRRSQPGRNALEGGSGGADCASKKWEALPPPPTEPRCVIEGRLKARLEEMRDA
eukprot:3742119-Alexandrium_andersonii.AAC.1